MRERGFGTTKKRVLRNIQEEILKFVEKEGRLPMGNKKEEIELSDKEMSALKLLVEKNKDKQK